MSRTHNESLRILRFWRDLEVFNIPAAPSARDANSQTKISTLRRSNCSYELLPWHSTDFSPTKETGYVHVVYVGVADTEDLSKLLLKGIFLDQTLSERECRRVTGSGWLAAFVVDESGRPKPDSYLPASFAQGVAAMRETRTLDNLNARIARAKEEFAQRCQQLQDNARANTANVGILAWDDLDIELDIVRRQLGKAASDPRLDWRVVVRTSRVKRNYLDDNLEAAKDFLNSFYLDDLDRLIAQAEIGRPFGAALQAYLGPPLRTQDRIDILTNHAAMAGLVSAKRLPSARWPASPKHPLVLAQHAAVSQVTHSLRGAQGLIGVNGPPGTGKTTLLCDVIAEIVTERARRIASLDRPVALFEEKITVAGKSFYPLKADVVAGTSIVVTSTNNNAVKNITQELPASKKVAAQFDSADYFANVMREVFRAQKVLDENKEPVDTWGTIAAALGNASNRRSFAQGFFRDEYVVKRQTDRLPAQVQGDEQGSTMDPANEETGEQLPAKEHPPSIKQVLEAASNEYPRYQEEWRKARQSFLTLQAEFESCRTVLERAETAALRIGEARSRLNELLAEEHTLEQDLQTRQSAVEKSGETLVTQRTIVEANKAVLAQLRAGTPRNLWDWLMEMFGQETRRMADLRQSLEAPTRALAEASATLARISKEVAASEAALEQRRTQRKAAYAARVSLERELEEYTQALQAGHEMGVTHYPDKAFWLLAADTRHRASVTVGPKLDDLRARLFLQAVDLHRLTVLANAGKFIANLRAVNGMLTGGSRDKLSTEHRPLLWDAFFFVVPVVSTTLASFDRLFAGMGQASLGWLLVDEAGQATPQSAAGAIWRSQRAVLVGDPLQIEPVFTVPKSVADELRRHHDVAAHWSPIDESVQTLADRLTHVGSWVETTSNSSSDEAPERIWTGMPLRTHRRCDDPMFSVANRIAYAGQMVQGRVDESGQPTPWDFSCSLGESTWLDVRSDRVKHPVSEDEIDCLLDCLAQLRRDGNKAKIYAISPFSKVAQLCRDRAKAAKFEGVECGTVHAFQGKEAQIVFLVLGTAPGQQGSGARSWAASKPNLLNVAVTRAQCRLYVIGDTSQWGSLDYFRELLSALPVRSIPSAKEKSNAL
ncbi:MULTISPECIES: DEAD/DEAH box helicase [unclassified Achromobacter]|uniref:DEAD/DEAH box helicase n=1 Tax=unclassified Achromobacter TaxID=2626865 RepID=UPI000B51594B|nr:MULTISPECIES: ATP-binding protein [unclassified Achromobacter]OWT80870.1 DNA helicase [Achromobacter sp. HZ34]OWT81386.1 DNA helicase [Achromobacter sp. HZ28]